MKEPFLQRMRRRVLLCDGGTGTLIQAEGLDLQKDFKGLENCSEILLETRPDFIQHVHRSYLGVGADCVETNTFGANRVVLSEYDLAEESYRLNYLGASLATQVADEMSTDEWPRYVLGSLGPGTKLPSLGHIDYDTLENSYAEQAAGLLDGGIDAFLLETHQDLLTLKAAINGCRRAMTQRYLDDVPILAQVTVETTGTLLAGSDMSAVVTALAAMKVDAIGLNCATGPTEMAEHIRYLAEYWPGFISVMPNAGLPILVDGKTEYPLDPSELALWHQRFIEEDGINLAGGCCGTTPEHIRAVRTMLDQRGNPAPKTRKISLTPSVSSLYTSVPLRQENAVFAIGERANANGSKKFRDLLAVNDWEALTGIGREQVKEGSHALDVCVAYVGRDESSDMAEVINRYRSSITIPLMVDSTDASVIEAALKYLGGKSIINSINFEDGEEKAAQVLAQARRFGAAVVALTIDEQGMAKQVEDKIRIAERLYDFAVNQHGLPAHDLIFDPLTFTIATGMEEDRLHGVNTLEAIAQIVEKMPACQIVLGLSNISFGLKPAARQVLNSVFLHEAMAKGLTAAIIHVVKILPLHLIEPRHREAALDLIYNRWHDGRDPLLHFIECFKNVEAKATEKETTPKTIEEVLRQRIIDGNRQGLKEDILKAMEAYPPLAIINDLLLDGMRVVGELFGRGELQLPFVLQSAETMKAAVALLEPYMEKEESANKGTLVLATVKGDVHDIGKNLVDIILTNNGYRVVNLGIKQPIQTIIDAVREHKADAVGMSGLLVKSTVIMKENLEEMSRQGLALPVLLGGAALTRKYVENDCRQVYTLPEVVYYAKDAFSGLRLMEEVMSRKEKVNHAS